MKVMERKARLLYKKGDADQSEKFYFTSFTLGEDASAITLSITTHCPSYCQIPFSLFSPSGEIRIMKTEEGGKGDYTASCRISAGHSDRGGMSGRIEKGEWKLILHKRRFSEDVDADISISIEEKTSEEESDAPVRFFHGIKNEKKQWYKGELHVHSNHSTGRSSIKEIIDTAAERNLDFIAITDHFTVSHWDEEALYSEASPVLLIQSMELSGDRGHANLHGIKTIKNPYVDDDGTLAAFLGKDRLPDMEAVADSVHEENGLFSINHIDSNIASAWRYHEFPLAKADILEVWCTSEGSYSLRYPAIWDQMLISGYRITGVASSDSHKASGIGIWELGNVVTWVYSENLSEEAILQGIKKGYVFMAKGDARLDFYADCDEAQYCMGDELPLNEGTLFTVELTDVPKGNLIIYLSGQVHDIVHFDDGDHKYSFSIGRNALRNENGYIRLEYYDETEPPRFWGDVVRSYDRLRLLSNPIYIRK